MRLYLLLPIIFTSLLPVKADETCFFISQYEKDLIGERVVSGLQNARKKGRIGGRPTNLTPELEEKIVQLREKKLGLNKISAECKVSVPTIRKVLDKVA